MKKLSVILINILAIALTSCSTQETPTPQQLTQDIQSLPPSTIISVVAKDNYQVPTGAQIIERTGLYETTDNTYDEKGYRILIPRQSIVRGVYSNDGKKCMVTWKAIYANRIEYKKNAGSIALSKQVAPTFCDPVRGIKQNDRLRIHLNKNLPL
ncbi:MAG: hypothetical protein ACK5Z5_04355 [Neisseriaceae bacterium]|jgi:TusA-related sulfurtransferase